MLNPRMDFISGTHKMVTAAAVVSVVGRGEGERRDRGTERSRSRGEKNGRGQKSPGPWAQGRKRYAAARPAGKQMVVAPFIGLLVGSAITSRSSTSNHHTSRCSSLCCYAGSTNTKLLSTPLRRDVI